MKRKIILFVLWLCAVAWLILCLYLSWQTGEETSVGLSWKITQLCLMLLKLLGVQIEAQTLHMQIRLAAHFGVFFIAGVLFAGAFAATFDQTMHRYRNSFLAALAVSAAASILAEIYKLNIPGRHLQWNETGLNVIGGIAGVILVQLVYIRIRKKLNSR